MEEFLASRPQISTTGGNRPRLSQALPKSGGLPGLHAEVRSKSSAAEAGHTHAPEVETVMVNGRIRRLHITCRCGEEIVVHCEYPQ